MLDPRLPFPDSVGGSFQVKPLLKKSIRVYILNGCNSAGRATMIDTFEDSRTTTPWTITPRITTTRIRNYPPGQLPPRTITLLGQLPS